MADEHESRREALKIIGAISVTCAFPFSADELYGQHTHLVQVRPAAQTGPKFFQPDEFRLISRIADLIIPRTDTPGASEAGVPLYIDMVVASNEKQQQVYRQGIAWLERASRQKYNRAFLELTEEQQYSLLEPLCDSVDRGEAKSEGERFFASIKNMTADGYYTSKVGLIDELGYRGNTVLPQFPECTHEH